MSLDLGALGARIFLETTQFSRGVNTVKSGFGAIQSSIMSIDSAMNIASRAFGFFEKNVLGTMGSFINAADATEKYKITLDSVLHSQTESARMFDIMAGLAAKSSREYDEIMNGAAALAGVMKGGVNEVEVWMKGILDLSAVYNMSVQETTSNIVRLYSAGANSADLFREKGILAAAGFSQGAKVGIEESRKAMLDFFDTIKGADERYGKTWTGLISMMSDKWFAFRNMVMNDSGLFDGIKNSITQVIEELDRMSDTGELKIFARDVAVIFKDMVNSVLASIKMFIQGVGVLRKTFNNFDYVSKNIQNEIAIAKNDYAKERVANYEKIIAGNGDFGTNKKIAMDNIGSARANQKITEAVLKGTSASLEANLKEHIEIENSVNAITEMQGLVDKMFISDSVGTEAYSKWTQEDTKKAVNNIVDGMLISEKQNVNIPAVKINAIGPTIESAQAQVNERPLKGGITNIPETAETKRAAKEAASAIAELQDKVLGVRNEMKMTGLSEYEAGLQKVKNETEQLTLSYAEHIAAYPKEAAAIHAAIADYSALAKKQFEQEWAAEKASEAGRINVSMLEEMSKIQKDIDTSGLDNYSKAMLEIKDSSIQAKNSLKDYLLKYPEEEKNIDSAISKIEKLNIIKLKTDDKQNTKAIKQDLKYQKEDVGMIGLGGDYEQHQRDIANITRDYDAMILKGGETKNMADGWREQQVALLSLSETAKDVSDVFRSMEDAMTNALAGFAKTGSIDLKGLITSLGSVLQIKAASKIAELLMTAAFEGVMELVEPGQNHGKKAMAALAAAPTITALAASFLAGSALSGMAHDGISNIPEDGTWLLKKGERVIDADTNKDLKGFMGSGQSVNMVININNSDEQGVNKALPGLRRAIIEAVSGDVASNGQTIKTIRSYL